jgi:putative hydrolases of HD superfamily
VAGILCVVPRFPRGVSVSGDLLSIGLGQRADLVEQGRVAADRLFGLLPPNQAAAYPLVSEEFEGAKTPDALFAKAVDRLQPIILNYAAYGGTWTDYGVDEARDP